MCVNIYTYMLTHMIFKQIVDFIIILFENHVC
jgi:hypothetical protein